MGKPTGFMEYRRVVSKAEDPKERIKHFREFKEHLSKEEQQLQGVRCSLLPVRHDAVRDDKRLSFA